MPSEILLILPAYRESRRLPPFLRDLCAAVAAEPNLNVSIQVVDDGSGAKEQTAVSTVCADLNREFPFLSAPLLLTRNRGKGGAIYAGWKAAEESTKWLAFVDSDGAVAPREVIRFLISVRDADNANECVFAARVEAEGTEVKRTLLRGLMGNAFRLLVRLIHRLPLRDTQCGLKAVPRARFQDAYPFLTEERFCFDIDLARNLMALDVNFIVVPISWSESPGSKINAFTTVRMFLTVFLLRFRKTAVKRH